ncbi:MAG TPA: hypothetical protein O0X70_07390 [Methanocorpusculum sp.]|nr:hypothetical protein [Methanocorpusculum sp.]
MAFKALLDTLRLLVITPYVWICGVFAAFSILAVYFIGLNFNWFSALPVGLILLFILPAFIAGSYGIILENHGSPAVYAKYVRMGYFKCLLPMLLVVLIGFLAIQAVTYILLMMGLPTQTAIYFGLFIILPILFFWYFADLCAMLGARGLFGALKSSSRRVTAGSFSVTAFYLFNIAAFFLFDFLFDLIMPFFISPNNQTLQTISSMTETELINTYSAMSTEEMLKFVGSLITPEVISALVFSLSICVLFALPFFVTYKVCYFKRLLAAAMPKNATQNQPQDILDEERNGDENQAPAAPESVPQANAAYTPRRVPLPENDPHAGEDGEYDAKGRWFKYT